MKQINICIIAVFLCLTSCSNNDDNLVFISDIEGLWTLTSLESINFYDFNNDGIATNNIMNETHCYFNQQIVFNEDKTAVLKTTSYSEIYATLGSKGADEYSYSTNCIDINQTINLKWSASASKGNITLTGNGQTETLPVFNERFSYTDKDALKITNIKQGNIIATEGLRYTFAKQKGY